jgi:hypothetical protein
MNAADILKYGHVFLHEAIDDMPDAEWETPDVCGVWSSKDILSHLLSFETVLRDILQNQLGRAETPALNELTSMDPETYNTVLVTRHHARPWNDVLRELESVHAQVVDAARQIPKSTWQTPGILPWYGAEYDLDDFVVYMYYGHKREHGAQINVFKDVLKTR